MVSFWAFNFLLKFFSNFVCAIMEFKYVIQFKSIDKKGINNFLNRIKLNKNEKNNNKTHPVKVKILNNEM